LIYADGANRTPDVSRKNTILVLGDQLNRQLGALALADPEQDRVLMIESRAMIEGRNYHRQRLHLVLTAMRRFAAELEQTGFEVDYVRSSSLQAGLEEHRAGAAPAALIATEPNSRRVAETLADCDVEMIRSNQFLCHKHVFAEWVGDRRQVRLEDFYRWQRKRLGYLMDGPEPAGGRWNFDSENRQPPPRGATWPEPVVSRLDETDREVLEELGEDGHGSDPVGIWATSRRAALARLNHFVEETLADFGPYEDAMLSENWHLAHSMLSPYLNLGLLLPGEVCDRVEEAYRAGKVTINSAEGLIRQVIGWREFVWGIYWLWPEQEEANELGHDRDVPPAWAGKAESSMACLADVLGCLDDRAWVHHIPRLMVLSNFANLYGIHPKKVLDWMRERYIDGADWVMAPNVIGMGLWADGGRMSTKPYVSGGGYINRMSDYCSTCRFDPRKRVGDDACPFTTLYWDFLDRNRGRLESNGRMGRQYHNLEQLGDLEQVAERADHVVRSIRDGRL
jgi:deoxyribodipyrimidine photolyase-related protein